MDLQIRKMKRILDSILAYFVSFLLLCMTALVLYQVFTRYILDNPSDFTEELVRYLLVWTGFLGAAYGFSKKEHMALIFFKDKLKGKSKRNLSIMINLLIFLFAVFVMIIGGAQLSASTFGAKSALLGVPRGLVYTICPITGVFIALIQLFQIYIDIKGEGGEKEWE